MRIFPLAALIFTVHSGLLLAQQSDVVQEQARIIGGVSEAKPSPPAPPKVLPKYKINWSTVHQKKGHKVIFNQVQAPAELSRPIDKPLTVAQIAKRDEAFRAWALAESVKLGGVFTASATIYDHRATYVSWSYNGEKFAAWSNVDWNHLGGFSTFEGRGKRYTFFLFSGGTSTAQLRRDLEAGYLTKMPEIPTLPNLETEGARYQMVSGDESNETAMEFIEAIHDLYSAEKTTLAKAYQERLKNRKINAAERQALRENPPPKRDITINYWKKKAEPKGKEGK